MSISPGSLPDAAIAEEKHAISQATNILASTWAKPRDIAWAWTVLSDSQRGIVPEHSEARYRQILARHRWILGLAVPTTDATGCPTERYRGTPVGGMDRSSDPEVRTLVRVGDIRGQALIEGLYWPKEAGAIAGEGADGAGIRFFAEPGSRSNPLTSVINKACSSALNPDDVSSAWAELVRMAESLDRPPPLIGYVEGEGVKYQSEQGVRFLTRKNFGDRVLRARKSAPTLSNTR